VLVPGQALAEGDPERWKLTLLLRERPGVGNFAADVVAVVGDVMGTLPRLARATISLPRADQYVDQPPLFDGVVEFSFDSRAELEESTEAFRRTGLPAIEPLVDPAASSAAWTYEERWIWP
jgi:hypothetical protein